MKKRLIVGGVVVGILALAVVYTVLGKVSESFAPDFEFDDIKDEVWG